MRQEVKHMQLAIEDALQAIEQHDVPGFRLRVEFDSGDVFTTRGESKVQHPLPQQHGGLLGVLFGRRKT